MMKENQKHHLQSVVTMLLCEPPICLAYLNTSTRLEIGSETLKDTTEGPWQTRPLPHMRVHQQVNGMRL